MKESIKKFLCTALIFLFVISPFLKPQKAEALWGGGVGTVTVAADLPRDPTIIIKEMGMDAAAWIFKEITLSFMTKSIVDWINSGFEGQPTFLSNPGEFFKGLANQASGLFIQQLGMEDLLCGSFKPQIILNLKYSYKLPSMQKFRCTFEDAEENWSRFMEDFSAGGFESWLQITEMQNNPYGAYLMAEEEMEARAAMRVSLGQQELSWGGGFVTLKECSGSNATQEDYCYLECEDEEGEYGAVCFQECMRREISAGEICEGTGGEMVNTTPGKIIADELTKSLGMPLEELGLADEFSEIIGAILSNLINQFVTQGLKSLSEGGGSSWFDSAADLERFKDALLTVVNEDLNGMDGNTCPQLVSYATTIVNKIETSTSLEEMQGIYQDYMDQRNEIVQCRKDSANNSISTKGTLIRMINMALNEIDSSQCPQLNNQLTDLLERVEGSFDVGEINNLLLEYNALQPEIMNCK